MTRYPASFQQEAQVIERLTRVEEKLDALLDRATLAATHTADHDVRIRSLENANSRMLGIAAVLATLTGIGGSAIFSVFGGGG